MPDDKIKISALPSALSLNNTDVLSVVQGMDGDNKTTRKAALTVLAAHLLEVMQYNNLDTASKTIVDAINSVLNNLADEYDESLTYSVDDCVQYNGLLYQCNTDISTAEAWDPTHWTQIKAVDVGSGGGGGGLPSDVIAPDYDSSQTYEVGDYVMHEDQLYECNTDISTAEAWDPTHWTLTSVEAEMKKKADTSNTYTKAQTDDKIDNIVGTLFVPNYIKYAFYNVGGIAKLDISYTTWRTCIFECFAYVGKTLTVKTYNNNTKPIYAVNDNFEVLGTYTTTDTTSTTEKTYSITVPVGATMLLIPVYNNPEGAYDVVVSGMTIADDIDNKADIVDNKIGTVYIPNNYAKFAYYNNNGVATINAGLSTYKNISFDCKSYVGKTVIVTTYNTNTTPIFATDDNRNIIAEYKYSSGNVVQRTYYITIPVGATQLLISCYNNPVDTYFVEVKATVGNELLTIRNDIKNLKDSVSTVESNYPQIISPSKVIVCVNKTAQFYIENMIKGVDARKISGYFIGSVSSRYEHKFIIKNPTANANVNFDVFQWSMNSKTSKPISFEVVNDVSISGKKILFIGDSITEQGAYIYYLQNEHGIVSVGTRTTTGLSGVGNGIPCEGRSGWGAYNYCNDDTFLTFDNKFYNPLTEEFDFSYYMSENSIDDPDAVFINLGTNDIVRSTMEQMEQSYKKMIESIKAYNSSIPVFLWLPPTRALASNSAYIEVDDCMRAIVRILNFDNKETDGIYLVPVSMVVDNFTDYVFAQEDESAYNSQQITVAVDTIHPVLSGHHKTSDLMACYLKKYLV